jgi:hypothetical protein
VKWVRSPANAWYDGSNSHFYRRLLYAILNALSDSSAATVLERGVLLSVPLRRQIYDAEQPIMKSTSRSIVFYRSSRE